MKLRGEFKRPVKHLVNGNSDKGDIVELKLTRIKVCNVCVLTLLLYTCEMWVVCRDHLKRFKHIHQQYLRPLYAINWKMHVSDVEVLFSATELKQQFSNIGYIGLAMLLS